MTKYYTLILSAIAASTFGSDWQGELPAGMRDLERAIAVPFEE